MRYTDAQTKDLQQFTDIQATYHFKSTKICPHVCKINPNSVHVGLKIIVHYKSCNKETIRVLPKLILKIVY